MEAATLSSSSSSSPNVAVNKPTLTPKSIIYQKFGNKACYKIEEVQEESSQNGFPGLAITQKCPSLFRCYLQLPEFSVVSQPCKKKKEAEQSAALMAIQKVNFLVFWVFIFSLLYTDMFNFVHNV